MSTKTGSSSDAPTIRDTAARQLDATERLIVALEKSRKSQETYSQWLLVMTFVMTGLAALQFILLFGTSAW